MKLYVWTRSELHTCGIDARALAEMLREGEAVSLWRPDAVMSHRTAAWLHVEVPSVIEAYVRELPPEPPPAWLHLRVSEYGVYDDTGAFASDVIGQPVTDP